MENTNIPLSKFRIVFTRNGKQYTAMVKAISQEEALQKLKAQLATESPAAPAPKAMTSGSKREVHLFIQGTHCASCEVLIERKFEKLPGVKNVEVNYRTGETRVALEKGTPTPTLAMFENAIREKGYHVKPWSQRQHGKGFLSHWSRRDFKEVGAILLILFGGYLFLRQYDIIPKLAVTEGASYPFIFLVGLVAAGSSCLAVTGGLLLSMSGTWSQATAGQGAWKRLQPHLFFNLGRLASYAFFGGLIGVLGKAIAVSSQMSGLLMVLAAAFMVLTGLSMLNVIQKNPFLVSIPKRFQNIIHDASDKKRFGAPFLIGAATFFLPCGFTQSLQFYAMTTGSFEKGALTMLVFALGTMPALLGIGALSTFSKGTPYRLFLKFAGAFVLLLGLYNANNGLTLVGLAPDMLATNIFRAKASVYSSDSLVLDDPNVTYDGTRQIVSMKVFAGRYEPNAFTIRKGVPVEWHVNGIETGGCTSVLIVPKYNITKYIKPGLNTITFTPTQEGTVPFHCSMAMFKGKFIVVSDPSVKQAAAEDNQNADPGAAAAEACASGNCQRVRMEISREKGFYPRNFTVKKGIPVEWIIDDQIPLGGCMGTFVIPQYDVAQVLKIGENRISFTPDREGLVPFTCSTGSKLGYFNVTS